MQYIGDLINEELDEDEVLEEYAEIE